MRIIEETLPSGLKVILVDKKHSVTTSTFFATGAGFKYEAKENNGIAHFLEHMHFKGTKKRPTAFDMSAEIEGWGAQMNAAAGPEVTFYFVKFPSNFAGETPLDVLSDAVLNPLFDIAELEKEREVVIQESKEYEIIPGTRVGWLWMQALYGEQPAGFCPVGPEDNVRSFTREDLVNFKNQLYTTENSVFCMVGDVSSVSFDKIADFFEVLKIGNPKTSKLSVVETQKSPVVLVKTHASCQSYVMLGTRAYHVKHPKRHALNVLNTVLGGNSSSRIYNELRGKRALAYHVQSGLNYQSDVGSFFTMMAVDKGAIFDAINVVLGEYSRIAEEGISEDELKRAKRYISGENQMYLETSNSVARMFAVSYLLQGKIVTPEQTDEKIQAVTAEEVRAVAQDIFTPDKLNLAIVGPYKEGFEEEFLKFLKF